MKDRITFFYAQLHTVDWNGASFLSAKN